jgi:hypothetical protein
MTKTTVQYVVQNRTDRDSSWEDFSSWADLDAAEIVINNGRKRTGSAVTWRIVKRVTIVSETVTLV